MGTGLVLTRRWGRPPGTGTLTATGWQLTAGGLLVVPAALLVEGAAPAPDLPALAGYAWLTLAGTALAYALWFRGAARLPVTQVSLLGALSPLTAAVLGWAVLGQALAGWQLTGFALAVGATVAGQLPPRRPTGERQSRGPGWRGTTGSIRNVPGASSAAAASGRVKRASAAGPVAYDSRSIQRTSSAVQPSPGRAAISRSRRSAARVSSS
ncbi:EamA family transporter [Micromonospora sp. HSS6-12]|uniref:EamA family transporter n=1 Tax=Micromonospora thermarum TaxID=2720024 RepID=A0ABX0Z803_9ACTN|nr:EamA family transporter [Micromonospora thermarum]